MDRNKLLRLQNIIDKFIMLKYDSPFNCLQNQTGYKNITIGNIQVPAFSGFQLYLYQYLLCKLNLTVTIVRTKCDQVKNSPVVCFNSHTLPDNSVKNVGFAPLTQEYISEILSVLKQNKDLSYFSYINLFGYEIWCIFCFALLVNSVILYLGGNEKFKFYEIFLDLLVMFVEQTTCHLKKLKNISMAFYLQILIYIICSTILTKCFSGFLLKTYFIRTPTLTVETFEEIVSKPDIMVAGRVGLLGINSSKPKVYEILNKRLIEYEKHLNINTNSYNDITNRRLVKGIINRKSVLIVNSKQTSILQNFYLDSNLMESKNRYNLLFRFCYVTKDTPNYTRVYQNIKSGIESDLGPRWLQTSVIIGRIYAETEPTNSELDTNNNNDNQIELDTILRGPLIGIFIGYLLAILALIWEKF